MSYKIGEVAKFFGITADTLRYYEKEGLIFPETNEENGYRQYSLNDVFFLQDILFYRQIGMSIETIRDLMESSDEAKEAGVIRENRKKIADKLEHYRKLMIKLDNWAALHDEAFEYLGKYEIRPMPRELYRQMFTNRDDIPMDELKKSASPDENAAFFSTEAFCYSPETKETSFYIALDSQIAAGLDFNYDMKEFNEVHYDNCLFTVCEFTGDPAPIIRRVVSYTKRKKLRICGDIHGILSISLYSKEGRKDLYRVFVPVENPGDLRTI